MEYSQLMLSSKTKSFFLCVVYYLGSQETYIINFVMCVKSGALKCDHHISPVEIMSDFQLPLVQSLDLQFPCTSIHGCYFHISQRLWRKVQNLGLNKATRQKIVQRDDKMKLLKDELTSGNRKIDLYISGIRHCVVSFLDILFQIR